ncbi:MAG TPA: phosphatase PAP2 family protein [Polyangia bacterium]|nr:phosphatase PAP2 family protein [Polyangia bacterium]
MRRPRPCLYEPGLEPALRSGAEASFSFFSGHTSNTLASGILFPALRRRHLPLRIVSSVTPLATTVGIAGRF